jgi:hypothetical protein
MSTRWQVKRTVIPRYDGQRRWDYAYQFLLQWAMAHAPDTAPPCSEQQEDTHEHRLIRTRFDQPSTADPNH